MQIPEALAAVAAAHAATAAAAATHAPAGRDPAAHPPAAEASGPPLLTIDQVLRSQEMSLNRWVSSGFIADSCGALIVSSNIAMLGVLAAVVSGSSFFAGGVQSWALLLLTAGMSVGSLAAAAIVAFPRTATGVSESVVFFGSIARMTSAGYYERLRAQTTADYAADIAQQCHWVATLVNLKFRCLRIAVVLLLGAAIPWLACLYLANRIVPAG